MFPALTASTPSPRRESTAPSSPRNSPNTPARKWRTVCAPRERISQLGGTPDFDPATLAKRSHTEYVIAEETDLTRMLEENLVAERIVITTYQEIIRWLGEDDPTTRRLMESILEEEEERADALNDRLGN